MRQRLASLAGLREQVQRQVAELLPVDGPWALVDFPNYPNVGDSAIYLGQLACFRALRRPAPAYVSDIRGFDAGVMRRRVGRGPILLTGGGGFGDAWPTGHALRESILDQFPGNPIVQLPQSLHFRERSALERTRRIVNAHPDFTLLVRDRRSHELAGNEFHARAALCPDMAFCLGPLERTRRPGTPVLWLARTDKESATPTLPGDAPRADWRTEGSLPIRNLIWRLTSMAKWPGLGPLVRPLAASLYEPLARQRLRRGLDLLGSARVLITDRLHGHILALLLGIPHVTMDNSTGKLSAFHEAWTAGIEGVRWADTAEEAWNLACDLADQDDPSAVARA